MTLRKLPLVIAAVAAVALALAVGPASADYGNTAVYQIEISANITGQQGGGAWLWIELDANHTGTYSGSDCGRGGATADSGDITNWTSSNGTLTISGVVFNGFGGLPVTVTVPSTYGHYDLNPIQAVFPTLAFLPHIGWAQVQVAP